jgi:hypothetical protein
MCLARSLPIKFMHIPIVWLVNDTLIRTYDNLTFWLRYRSCIDNHSAIAIRYCMSYFLLGRCDCHKNSTIRSWDICWSSPATNWSSHIQLFASHCYCLLKWAWLSDWILQIPGMNVIVLHMVLILQSMGSGSRETDGDKASNDLLIATRKQLDGHPSYHELYHHWEYALESHLLEVCVWFENDTGLSNSLGNLQVNSEITLTFVHYCNCNWTLDKFRRSVVFMSDSSM